MSDIGNLVTWRHVPSRTVTSSQSVDYAALGARPRTELRGRLSRCSELEISPVPYIRPPRPDTLNGSGRFVSIDVYNYGRSGAAALPLIQPLDAAVQPGTSVGTAVRTEPRLVPKPVPQDKPAQHSAKGGPAWKKPKLTGSRQSLVSFFLI